MRFFAHHRRARGWPLIAVASCLFACATAEDDSDGGVARVTGDRARPGPVPVDADRPGGADAGEGGIRDGAAGDAARAEDLDARPGSDSSPAGADAAAAIDGARPPADGRPPAEDALALDGRPPVDAALPDEGPPPDPPDAARDCRAETCNAFDDDCDGHVDEGAVCGDFIERRCRLTLAWADNLSGPAGPSAQWGPCPGQARHMAGDVRCTTTLGDGRFVRLDLDGDVDGNDQLAVALICQDFDFPDVAAWLQTHCALFLGHADVNGGPDDVDRWGACPDALSSAAAPRCTSSGRDGLFRAMQLSGQVNEDDDLGVAWICAAPDEPRRAAGAQAAVEVQLAWSAFDRGAADGAEDWGFACPGTNRLRVGRIFVPQACQSTRGDGRFHRLDFAQDVDDNDDLGIALKRR